MAYFVLSTYKKLVSIYKNEIRFARNLNDFYICSIAYIVAIGEHAQQACKVSNCGPSKQQQEITNKITLLLLVHTAYIQVLVSPHILFVLNHAFYAMPTSVSNVGQI